MLKNSLAALAAGSRFAAAHSRDTAALLVKHSLEQVPLVHLIGFIADFTALDKSPPSWTTSPTQADDARRYLQLKIMGVSPQGLPPGRYLSSHTLDVFIDRLIVGGTWRTCMNCYDQGHGHAADTAFHSPTLGCWLGDGCRECDYVGAVFTPDVTPHQETSPAAPVTTLEDMLCECVPGGSVCDPQRIADSIRAWFTEHRPTVFDDATSFERLLDAEYHVARTLDLTLDEAEFKARRRYAYSTQAKAA